MIHFEMWHYNKVEAEKNGLHFADDIFKHIFLNENIYIPIKICS